MEVISQLPTGAFADLFGRKLSLAIGNLFMALPMFLIAYYPRPEIMVAYAVMWGAGRAFCMGTSKPILYETLSAHGLTKEYPKLLSRAVILFQLSAAISIATGGYLYQIAPNLPYIVSGLASLVGVFSSRMFIESRQPADRHSVKQFVHTAHLGFVEIFKNSYIAKLTILYALTLGMANTSQQFFMQPYMLELGLNDIQRSWVAMLIKILIAVLGAKVLANAKVYYNKYFLLIIPLLMTIFMLPAKFATLPWAYLIFFGIAFNSGNTDLFLSPEINEHLNSNIRSTAISIQRMLASAFGTLLQWFSIGVVVKSGVGEYYSYQGIFTLAITLPLAYLLVQHKHRHRVNLASN